MTRAGFWLSVAAVAIAAGVATAPPPFAGLGERDRAKLEELQRELAERRAMAGPWGHG